MVLFDCIACLLNKNICNYKTFISICDENESLAHTSLNTFQGISLCLEINKEKTKKKLVAFDL